MWMCTTEIANRKSPWVKWQSGEECGEKLLLHSCGDCLCLYKPIAALLGHHHFSLKSSMPVGAESLSQRQRGKIVKPTLGRLTSWGGGCLGPENQSNYWLWHLGGGHCSLVAKFFKDGADMFYMQFLNCLMQCLAHGRCLMSVW